LTQLQPDVIHSNGHATFAREHEYKRRGTVSLLACIDLLTGKVHTLDKNRHRSREFIEFLKLLDAAYPASTAIKPKCAAPHFSFNAADIVMRSPAYVA
jgi:hypothetical protein